MEQPILNPPNPYVGTLRIFPETLVKIAGRPRPNANRFAINLQTGPSLNPRDDLALHLSPCFSPPKIIRNTLRMGAWGLEESWGNGSILMPTHPFEIMILAEPEQFKIAINSQHYCEFKHRIPYQEITHLTIDGDVDIDRITITSSPYSQHPTSMYQQQPSAPPTGPSMHVPPYHSGPSAMPMPPMYPSLPTGSLQPTPPYPVASGPVPTPATYMSGYPQSGMPGYPGPQGAYPQMGGPGPAHGYPTGPMPAGASYQGYPPQQQPGHSSTPFGNLPIGGKTLGTLAGVLKEGVYRKFPYARHFL